MLGAPLPNQDGAARSVAANAWLQRLLRWWWIVVASVAFGNFVPGAILIWFQNGWPMAVGYLTTWGALRSAEEFSPLVFWVVSTLLLLLAVVGFVVDLSAQRRQRRTRERRIDQLEEIEREVPEMLHADEERLLFDPHTRQRAEQLIRDSQQLTRTAEGEVHQPWWEPILLIWWKAFYFIFISNNVPVLLLAAAQV